MGSAVPNICDRKLLNKKLRTNPIMGEGVLSPLTATNDREKQFKANLAGTYGQDYEIKRKAQQFLYHTTVSERRKERKDINEALDDVLFSKSNSIP